MTKLEEVARKIGEEFYLWATVEHPELVAQPHYYAGRIQAELEPVLKPLLDAAESARLLLATEKLLHLVPEFGEQLSQWRKK